ncbi:DUF3472 domain-containing protein [Prevotella sp. 10(H)]|uniref:DUF3472 domain-containing protein n=1 Tax=Prevotella sp. 10(H) TaxID=1158294 RepID=UPI0009DD0A20|nr:DUF3472 domain-containing protein [Prevotella sp. 10(H)]
MKHILLSVALLLLSGFHSCSETNKPSEDEILNTFTVPANKGYAEPFSTNEAGVSVPVGWPETVDVVSQWTDKEKSVVWYLYQKEGVYDFYLDNEVAKGKKIAFDLNISECYDLGFNAINKKVELRGTGEYNLQFCTGITIPKTGYYRYELKPISDPANAITIRSLIFNSFKPEGQVNHTDYQSSPSVHINFSSTSPTTKKYDWLYEEIIVPEGGDPLATFYMAIGFYRGYFGIQTNSDTERRVLFSIWDSKDAENDKSINASDYVTLVDKDEATTVNSFGGEGTGGQSYVKTADWKTGKPVKFLLNVLPQKNNSVVLSAWYSVDNGPWNYVASWRAPHEKRYFDGFHSFLENYGYTNGQLRREAYYYNAWGHEAESEKWINFNKVRFSNTDGKEGQRVDYEQGVSPKYPDRFYMSSGGYTPTIKTADEMPLSVTPPQIDIKKFTERVNVALENESKYKGLLQKK